jgi:outer membrane biosynthesis protein TonB
MTTRRASLLLPILFGTVLALSVNQPASPAWAGGARSSAASVPPDSVAAQTTAAADPVVVADAADVATEAPGAASDAVSAAAIRVDAPAPTATPRRGTVAAGRTPKPTAPPAPAATSTPAPAATSTPAPAATSTPAPTESPEPTPSPAPSPSPQTWTLDLYDARAPRYQNPDNTACTAAAAQSMLNTIAYTGSASGFMWQPTTSYAVQEEILAYERANMTMLTTSAGSDPHGWRNALNYYGWGSISAGVYRDSAYSSFDAAAKAAVRAVARYHKPVGILARAGTHAQFITGYQVTGDDPTTGSSDFSIIGVNLTDPYQAVAHRDFWLTYADWRSGGTWLRFSPYTESDSPYADPIDGHVGTDEWYGHWVLIVPVR